MDEIASSYEYHRLIESPLSFVRREWLALAIFGGGFVVLMLVGLFALDPAFFYPRLSTDPLLYFMKGMSFAETGRAEARLAVNIPPVHYVSMPGILRAPAFLLFEEFDTRLRAIQVANVFLVALTAAMYAYILSWAVSRSWHWVAVGFTYTFFVLSPWWITNVLAPLGDAPYSAFSALACIIAVTLLISDTPLRRRGALIALGVAAFSVAFLIRFTAPALFLFAGTLAIGRAMKQGAPVRRLIIGAAASVTLLLALIAMNWETLSRRYLGEALLFLANSDARSMLLNLFSVAIPAQVLPAFQLGFTAPPLNSLYTIELGSTVRDVMWACCGGAISAILLLGMWRVRRQFLGEVLYVLAPLPVLMLILPSTSRYLMAYQPFIWMFFSAGVAVAIGPLTAQLRKSRTAFAIIAALSAAAAMTALRANRIAGTENRSALAVSIAEVPEYAVDVATVFSELRVFLETLPRERTLLIGARGTPGRWKAISDIDYYFPDSALTAVAKQRDLYLLDECGTREYCLTDPDWESFARAPVEEFGRFSYEMVFKRETSHARAAVFRMHPLE
ncbi:MAG: hypothetical protein M3Q09_13430 [Gemmatimonadota bacterium]|nr:hypothetical protein [Gemmatimonadota bacterium]